MKNIKNQKGISLFETVLAVGIIAIAVAYMTNRHFTDREILIDRAMGQYMSIASQGLEEYINANQTAILAGTIPSSDGTCASNVCTINTTPTSGFNNYLPDNFLSRSPWYKSSSQGTMTAKIRVSGTVPYQVIQGFVFSVPIVPNYGDVTSQNTHLSAVVSKGGLNIGAVYPGSGSVVGNNGTWSVNLTSLYGNTLPTTTLVSRTGDGMPQVQTFLKLDGSNDMTGSLNMGGTNNVTSDMTNINTIQSTGVTNAPNVQYSGYSVAGNVNLGAGGATTQGLNFVQDQTASPLGGIWADSNAGGTAFLGPNFILGSKAINANLTNDPTPTAATWYLPTSYIDSIGHLKIGTWNSWQTISMDMTGFGTGVSGETASLGVAQVENLIFNTNSGSTSKMEIVGNNPNFLGSGNNGVTNINNLMLVYAGGTNVTTSFVAQSMVSAANVTVDQVNSTTWSSAPVDVTMAGEWHFNGAAYTKNVQFVPQSIKEGGSCTSFNGTGGTSVASNIIGAILYCKGGVWVAGWF